MTWTARLPEWYNGPLSDEYYPFLPTSQPFLLENTGVDWTPRPVIT